MTRAWKLLVMVLFVAAAGFAPAGEADARTHAREAVELGLPGQDGEGESALNRRIAMSSAEPSQSRQAAEDSVFDDPGHTYAVDGFKLMFRVFSANEANAVALDAIQSRQTRFEGTPMMPKVCKFLLAFSIVAGVCLLPSHNARALELEREVLGLGAPRQDEEGSGAFNRRIAVGGSAHSRPAERTDTSFAEHSRRNAWNDGRIAWFKLAFRVLLQARQLP